MNCHSEKASYQQVLEDSRREFLTQNFQDMAAASGGRYSPETHRFFIDFFGVEHCVDCSTGTVGPELDTPDRTSEFITIFHYLNRYQSYHGFRATGDLVSLKELPGGVAGFYPSFKKMADDPLMAEFGYGAKNLLKAAEPLKGVPASMGDASITLHAFAHVPVTLVVWEGDEEMGPSASVLFDSSVHRFVHNEMVISLGVIAVSRAIAASRAAL